MRLLRTPAVGPLVRWCYENWWRIQRNLYKNWTKNPPSRRQFTTHRRTLLPIQVRIVSELRARVIATVQFSDLFPDGDGWDDLQALVDVFSAGVCNNR